MKLLACLDAVLKHRNRGCFVHAESREQGEPLLRCCRPKGKEVSKALSKLEEQPFSLREISQTETCCRNIDRNREISKCRLALSEFHRLFPFDFSSPSFTSLKVFQGC